MYSIFMYLNKKSVYSLIIIFVHLVFSQMAHPIEVKNTVLFKFITFPA